MPHQTWWPMPLIPTEASKADGSQSLRLTWSIRVSVRTARAIHRNPVLINQQQKN